MLARFSKLITKVPVASRLATIKVTPIKYYSVKKFTESHEWVQLNDKIATIGITKHASDALGEIVFAELPENESKLEAGDYLGSVESVKAVGEINSPVSGKVVEINETLVDDYSVINEDPENKGWLCKVEIENEAEVNSLMDSKAYTEFLKSE
ncbi:glycine cleavage system H protein, partial [Neoconidiobolus thromboides FSU 785]